MNRTGPVSARTPRIAYIVHQFFPEHVGGTEVYTLGLARRAVAAGFSVRIFTHTESATTRPEDVGTVEYEHDGVTVVAFRSSLGAARNVARAEYDNRVARTWLERQLAAWEPDLVHVTHPMQFGVDGIDVPRRHGTPVVVTATDHWFLCPRTTLLRPDATVCGGPVDARECVRCVVDLHGLSGRRREARAVRRRASTTKAALARADRVILLTEFQRSVFARNGCDLTRSVLVPHGPAAAEIGTGSPSAPVPGARTRFVLPGTIATHKGTAVAIAALAAVPDLDAELVVHGPGDERDPYVRRVLDAAAVDDRVRIAGPYAPADLGALLAEAHYLLAPSLAYDNAPIVPKAALALGVPVIASDLGTLAGLVTDGVDGRLVPPGDVAAWSAALRRAVDERDRWSRTPRPQPTADDHARQVLEIYAELLA